MSVHHLFLDRWRTLNALSKGFGNWSLFIHFQHDGKRIWIEVGLVVLVVSKRCQGSSGNFELLKLFSSTS